MPRQASEKQLAKFRRDAEWLKQKFPSEEIAKKIDVLPTNFSSYCTGSKNPGPEIIDRFYEIYDDELNTYKNDTDRQNEFTGDTDEPAVEIKLNPKDDKDDHINTLKANNADFRATTRDLSKSNLELARSASRLAKSNYILAQNNQYMVFKHRPRRYRGRNKPPESE